MDIDFTPEQLVAFYRSTSTDGRKAVKEALGEQFSEALPATERVKTYEDAVWELGNDHPLVEAASSAEWRFTNSEDKDIIAYLKLRVIVAALNDGWKPQFVPGELRWYPWYELISKDEYDAMSEDEKQERRCVGRSSSGAYASGGLVCSSAYGASSNSLASSGSRLAFKSEALAEYAGKQFAELFANFCFIPKSDEKE
ncbi:hypothetical protein [Muribaculum sp.]|uniref:hypothetical protein n=1 Tax=Muribaculum sp. TaxID=1918611 RepID=UPI00258E6882|nr:hypothetical protein [Muribaculum sp.]MCX4277977.1 hypothetical protein [Muribaculum sp.]